MRTYKRRQFVDSASASYRSSGYNPGAHLHAHLFALASASTHSDRLGGVARIAIGIQASTSTAQWSFGSTAANVGPWRL